LVSWNVIFDFQSHVQATHHLTLTNAWGISLELKTAKKYGLAFRMAAFIETYCYALDILRQASQRPSVASLPTSSYLFQQIVGDFKHEKVCFIDGGFVGPVAVRASAGTAFAAGRVEPD
jgi:hypothetical protein